LPKLPVIEGEESSLPQLPSLPSNQFGEKFSQNVIKEAVIRNKPYEYEEEEEKINPEDLIPRVPKTKEVEEKFVPHAMKSQEYDEREYPEEFKEPIKKLKKNELFLLELTSFKKAWIFSKKQERN
jgi:hypothetical protein